jgi:tRNA(adenine34) deaminase
VAKERKETQETAALGMESMEDRNRDKSFMRLALAQAAQAAEAGDVPVGAVLVCRENGQYRVLAEGHNTKEQDGNALGHAEMNVISAACQKRHGWRLFDCTLYVTMEPCPMCAGAILGARIPRVIYGTGDPVMGAMGSVWSLHRHPVQGERTTVACGCMEAECRSQLQTFFQTRREAKKETQDT